MFSVEDSAVFSEKSMKMFAKKVKKKHGHIVFVMIYDPLVYTPLQ